jgi:ABC-type Fe3+/spermidine/putrescine transport system ATPase subunit
MLAGPEQPDEGFIRISGDYVQESSIQRRQHGFQAYALPAHDGR